MEEIMVTGNKAAHATHARLLWAQSLDERTGNSRD
jgi:hypothetical protein